MRLFLLCALGVSVGMLQPLAQERQRIDVIGYDSREILADFSRRQGITYPLLSDQRSATIRRYGPVSLPLSWTVALTPYVPGAPQLPH